MPAQGPTRQRRKEARPQELLDAALAVFVERGFAAARTGDVAQRAGVSKGTLYLYYPSKEDLLKAVITHSLAEQFAAAQRELDANDDPAVVMMRGFLVQWWQRVLDGPASGVFKLMVTEVRNHPDVAEFYAREVMVPGERVLCGLIERGIARGEFRRPNDLRHAVHSLLLPLVMICVHKHSLGACACPLVPVLDAHRFIADHVDLIIAALGGPAPAPAASPPVPEAGSAPGPSRP